MGGFFNQGRKDYLQPVYSLQTGSHRVPHGGSPHRLAQPVKKAIGNNTIPKTTSFATFFIMTPLKV